MNKDKFWKALEWDGVKSCESCKYLPEDGNPYDLSHCDFPITDNKYARTMCKLQLQQLGSKWEWKYND